MDQNKIELAECVGLWLAEGSTTSHSEITFTNTCLPLIDQFYKTIKDIFKEYSYNPRIYVYSKEGSVIPLPYKDCAFKYYVHSRATKPFFIFRVASVNMTKEWKKIIEQTLKDKDLQSDVLRGFFAGEGNVHTGKRSVRVLRISQGRQKEFIDDLLNGVGLRFSFYKENRYYILSGKSNWDIFAKLKLADLHPQKKEKFWITYNCFKEEHYPKNYLSNSILQSLNSPQTSQDLAKKLNRSSARISEVLVNLKKANKIKNSRIRSTDYWTSNLDLILISQIKANYLSFLDKERKTAEFAKYFDVDWKSSFKRLNELKKLKLVKQTSNNIWTKIPTSKEIWQI